MLLHPVGEVNKCHYDPLDLQDGDHKVETYGIRDQEAADHFFQTEDQDDDD